MHTYLIHHNGKGRVIELDTGATSAEEFGRLQLEFAIEAGAKGPREYADMDRLYPDQKREGIYYDWELAGPDGASYRLFVLPGTDPEAVKKAKATIRHEGDVVRLYTVRIRELI